MNLNFKLLAILIIILGFLVLGKYSLYAHNRIEELNNDVNEYQKAFTESNKARVHYEAISESIVEVADIFITKQQLEDYFEIF